MWTIIFLVAVTVAVGCFIASKWWIDNKTNSDGEVYFGKTTVMVWGEDPSDVPERMVTLAKEIFSKGELLKSEDGFDIQVITKNNAITEVVVRTNKTKVSYTGKELNVINTANTKIEVIAFFTLMSWCIIALICLGIPFLVMSISFFIQVFSMI